MTPEERKAKIDALLNSCLGVERDWLFPSEEERLCQTIGELIDEVEHQRELREAEVKLNQAQFQNVEALKALVTDLSAALEAYVRCRFQDCDHGEDCPKHYCDDNECERCDECNGESCDCGISKALIAWSLAKPALAKAVRMPLAKGEKP